MYFLLSIFYSIWNDRYKRYIKESTVFCQAKSKAFISLSNLHVFSFIYLLSAVLLKSYGCWPFPFLYFFYVPAQDLFIKMTQWYYVIWVSFDLPFIYKTSIPQLTEIFNFYSRGPTLIMFHKQLFIYYCMNILKKLASQTIVVKLIKQLCNIF